jgi:hypothetical protein
VKAVIVNFWIRWIQGLTSMAREGLMGVGEIRVDLSPALTG